MSLARKKHLLRTIAEFSTTEQSEIYKILMKHGVSHSVNTNGAFFNLSTLPIEIFDEIEKCVAFFASNKRELDEFEMHIAELKNNKDRAPVPVDEERTPMTQCDERTHRVYDALFNISAQRPVKTRQVTKYGLAKKKFAKKQSVADARMRVTDVVDAAEILRAEDSLIRVGDH